jgi:hypothetical protein
MIFPWHGSCEQAAEELVKKAERQPGGLFA